MGLGKMIVSHGSLPSELKAHMESCWAQTAVFDMNSQDVSSLIYALGLMGYPWKSVNATLQRDFQRTIVNKVFSFVEVAGTVMALQGLAGMSAKWAMLTPEMRKKAEGALIAMVHPNVLKSKSHEAMAFPVMALGNMAARWDSFSPAFHNAVLATFVFLHDRLNSQDVSKFIYGWVPHPLFLVCR